MVVYQLYYYFLDYCNVVQKNIPIDDVQSQSILPQEYNSLVTRKMLWFFLSVTSIVWYLKYLWTRRKMYWYSRKIPGPLSIPIIGSGYMFLGSGSEILKKLISLQQRWPKLCKLWMGDELIVFISEPKHIETVLNSPNAIEKHDLYFILSEVLGEGLLTAKGKIWKRHRKMIAPSFNQKILDSFVDIFVEKSKIFSGKIKKLVGRKDVDWYLLTSRCTLDMVCETAMGVNMNIQCENEQGIGECLDILMELANTRIFNIFHHNPFLWKLSKAKQEFERNINDFQKVTSAVIRKKTMEYKNSKELIEDGTFNDDTTKKKPLAFLDLILESSDFTENELRAEMETFLGAGTETSAATLCSVFTVLGIFPEIQQKVYEEVIDIIGLDRDVQVSDLPKLKYTERVIKETLRLFPIGAMYGRKLTGDINLGDVILPGGCSAGFLAVFIHRNPKYWKDPLKFDPDRFLSEEVAKRHPCTYIPFSYGPRNCIGGRYAILNIKTAIATVIREYRIFSDYKSVEEIELKLQLLLRFKDGFKMWFEPR